jgi:hypothetical protein
MRRRDYLTHLPSLLSTTRYPKMGTDDTATADKQPPAAALPLTTSVEYSGRQKIAAAVAYGMRAVEVVTKERELTNGKPSIRTEHTAGGAWG